MQEKPSSSLNPSHVAPVGRLKLEVVDLKSPGIDAAIHGTLGTVSTFTVPGTIGSFADED